MDVYGLLGNPVEHSLSPPLHERAYELRELDARYVTFEVAHGELESALEGARALGIDGLNVTIPFKREVCEFVELDPLAERIGAVNTIDLEANVGYNTDAIGAVRALTAHGVDLDGTAVVVGAGGAGRAIAFGLADEGMRVRIANRTTERANSLARAVPGADGHGLDALPELLADAEVLINATSVGMDEDATPVPQSALSSELTVLDAVYTPIQTRLLTEADAVGAQTVDGAWMLLYQGCAAFERWTGYDAPVDAMNEALRKQL
ncbi:shikimate dehydrogenase [Halocatena halophila]|uniref:shikimate dehydrogenase n=1 Tax=Halocatena halophila TaxID=2814576 RepID=UPI002ED443E1